MIDKKDLSLVLDALRWRMTYDLEQEIRERAANSDELAQAYVRLRRVLSTASETPDPSGDPDPYRTGRCTNCGRLWRHHFIVQTERCKKALAEAAESASTGDRL